MDKRVPKHVSMEHPQM